MATVETIDRFLAIDTEQLTPPMAEALLVFSASEAAKTRVAELAEKANYGTLADDERDEYASYIQLDSLLTVAKSRARKFLSK